MEDDLTIKLQDYGETFDSLANVDNIQSEVRVSTIII